MGSNLNFDFGNEPPGNFSLVRQTSVYSLTFDEFQSTLGKDFGSMNMDELLKNIWSAEETQNLASTCAAAASSGGQNGVNHGGYLQRQGSLTLPRTLSLKTVDEVWRDMADGVNPLQAQRQPTLGEITLEEFLVRAGVVREDNQLDVKATPDGILGDIAQPNGNNTGFGISFQQPSHDNSRISLQSPSLPLNVNGVRTCQYQPIAPQIPQQQIFPKQNSVSCAPTVVIPGNSQLASPGIVEFPNPTVNGNLAHGSALQSGGMGMLGLGSAGMGVATGSPATLAQNGIKSNGDTASVSPVPYMFNGGLRGRKSSNAMEKVIERRQRRMIKNRESAARSRQRKQAYTMELEEEVAKLKEENEQLQKKQEQIIEMQKHQALEMMDAQYGAKRRCLRRTNTGPW